MINNFGKKTLIDLAVPLAKDILPELATKEASPVIGKFERKISWQGAVRAEKAFILFISNEVMDDIIKIVNSLEHSSLLIDGAIETVKHEIKKNKKVDFWCYDGTCGCFIDSTYGLFIDTTGNFLIYKCYIWKKSHKSREKTRKQISSIISITYNNESPGKRSHKSMKRI